MYRLFQKKFKELPLFDAFCIIVCFNEKLSKTFIFKLATRGHFLLCLFLNLVIVKGFRFIGKKSFSFLTAKFLKKKILNISKRKA